MTDSCISIVVIDDNAGSLELLSAVEEARRRYRGAPGWPQKTNWSALFPQFEVGAMPPLGCQFNMPVIVDETVAASEFIAFTAGTHRDVIDMRFSDFRRLVKPLVAAVAVQESVGA